VGAALTSLVSPPAKAPPPDEAIEVTVEASPRRPRPASLQTSRASSDVGEPLSPGSPVPLDVLRGKVSVSPRRNLKINASQKLETVSIQLPPDHDKKKSARPQLSPNVLQNVLDGPTSPKTPKTPVGAGRQVLVKLAPNDAEVYYFILVTTPRERQRVFDFRKKIGAQVYGSGAESTNDASTRVGRRPRDLASSI